MASMTSTSIKFVELLMNLPTSMRAAGDHTEQFLTDWHPIAGIIAGKPLNIVLSACGIGVALTWLASRLLVSFAKSWWRVFKQSDVSTSIAVSREEINRYIEGTNHTRQEEKRPVSTPTNPPDPTVSTNRDRNGDTDSEGDTTTAANKTSTAQSTRQYA